MTTVIQVFLDWSMTWALQASCRAPIECVKTFSASDYRQDLPKIKVPTLFIHGSGDVMTPPESTVNRSVDMVRGANQAQTILGDVYGPA